MDGWLRAARVISWAALIGVAGVFVLAAMIGPHAPPGTRSYSDIIYRRLATRRERLDVYVPARGEPPASGWPAVVAIHGGGWHGGSKRTFGREVARLAARGFVVISVEYILSRPGHPTWPDNLIDVRESVRWVRRHAEDYRIDPARIAALGSSAGGHLAALLGTNARGDDPETRVQAVVDLYGPTDLAGLYRTPKAVLPLELYFGRGPTSFPDRLYDAASPIAHASGRSAPMLLIHGEDDSLVPVAQSVAMAERLKSLGVPAEVIVVPGAGHAFGLDVGGRDLVPDIVRFLGANWSPRPATASRDEHHRYD